MRAPGRSSRSAVAVIIGGALLAAGCGPSSSPPVPARWTEVPEGALPGPPGSRPFVAVVAAGGPGRPWLIGGVELGGPAPAGGFRPSDTAQVAIWAAGSPSGPWRPAGMLADPERDGPQETIRFFAGPAVAFGWRNSPTEGYPRPSAWVAESAGLDRWKEIIEPREFFGGPNIVGFGGASAGPHGAFVAGTWTDPQGRPVLSVWHSADGRTWSQQAGGSAFPPAAGRTPFGRGIADSDHGVLLAATEEVPVASDPGREAGALWYSADGRTWTRVGESARTGGSSTYDVVTGTGAGWIVAGTESVGRADRAVAWYVDPGLGVGGPSVLPGPPSGPSVTGISADSTHAVIAGVAGGRPVLWTATLRGGRPAGRWSALEPPPATGPDVQAVEVSAGDDGSVLAVTGRSSSSVWHSPWH